ncbi:DUF1501 domain-containing protein [soil metagenome]
MQLTRRYFLQASGAVAVYLGVAPFNVLARGAAPAAGAAPGPGPADPLPLVAGGKTLVVLFLRGGADGLNLVVPHGDPGYYDLRKTIAIARPSVAADTSALDLDGFFALHPRLKPLMPHFASSLAVAAHAVGYDKNTRSHFEEQDTWETGIIGNTLNSDGWLNRHLATSQGRGPLRAISIGESLPRILHGRAQAVAMRGIDDLNLPVGKASQDAVTAALEHAYCCDPSQRQALRGPAMDLLSQSAQMTLDGVKQIRAIASQKYAASAEYPKSGLAGKLMQVARLIKANVGLEVAQVDLGGWDTHNGQGGAAGQFANLAGELAEGLDAFARDLGDKMEDVVVVTLTDFGRTAGENGTQGTDHGWANCMLLLGGAVQRANKAAESGGTARKVVTKWPGLAPDQLHQKRDLLHTTDFRDVLGELVTKHLGNQNLKAVLPNHEFKAVGLVA